MAAFISAPTAVTFLVWMKMINNVEIGSDVKLR